MKTPSRRAFAAKIRVTQFPNTRYKSQRLLFESISLDSLFVILSISFIGEHGDRLNDTLRSIIEFRRRAASLALYMCIQRTDNLYTYL
jgi:hypothetical protein